MSYRGKINDSVLGNKNKDLAKIESKDTCLLSRGHTWWYRSSLEPRCGQEGEVGGGRVHTLVPGGLALFLPNQQAYRNVQRTCPSQPPQHLRTGVREQGNGCSSEKETHKRYCPARWIRPKLGSFDRSSLKREARKVFRKIRPSPILREPFKVLARLLVFQFTIVQQFR
jgi:hypothetical protein